MTAAELAVQAADYAIVFVCTLAATLVLTPLVRAANRRLGMVDMPSARRINKVPVPRGGGIALMLGLLVPYSIFTWLSGRPPMHSTMPGWGVASWWKFVALSSAIGFVGLADDRKSMDPRLKLAFQVLVAFGAWLWLGVGFRRIFPSLPAAVDCAMTVFWIVGAVNAFNLIDGMDGLACGLAFIATAGMAGALILSNSPQSSLFHFALAGALVGFLRYNYNPASIFLGDCGSMFIGFTLAVLPLVHQTQDSMLVSIGVPLLAMGVPIFDTFLAIVRRSLRRFLLKRGDAAGNAEVMTADTDHLHHRLLRLFRMNQRKAVFALYALAVALVATGLFAMVLRSRAAGLWLVAVALGSFVIFKDMASVELPDAGKLLDSLARDKAPKARRRRARIATPFFVASDVLALFAVFLFCCWVFGRPLERDMMRIEMPLRLVCTFAALVAAGSYRTSWSRAMVSNYTALGMACAAGAILSGAAIYYSPVCGDDIFKSTMLFAPLSFLAVVAVRLARPVLRDAFYLVARAKLLSAVSGGSVRRVLVYGAGLRYRSFRRELVRSSAAGSRVVVGLIDDDMLLRGRRIGSVEVLGTLSNAPEIIREQRIDEVVIACEMTPEWFAVVRRTLEPLGVATTHFRFSEKPAWPQGAEGQDL